MLLIDTNIFSALVIAHPLAIKAYMQQEPEQVKISIISHGELLYGLHRKQLGLAKTARIESFLESIETISLGLEVAPIYGKLKADLSSKGEIIGANDLWIAAHALSLGATLVTNNVRKFKRVKGLKVENWVS
jgi:tRNA(fMet)-specific endonuclease VapC